MSFEIKCAQISKKNTQKFEIINSVGLVHKNILSSRCYVEITSLNFDDYYAVERLGYS